MGLKPHDLKSLTYKDYFLMWRAYHVRVDIEQRDMARHIIASIVNYAGMTAPNNPILPTDIFKLSLDKNYNDSESFIINIKQAKMLLNSF